jgi:hypothetical protein
MGECMSYELRLIIQDTLHLLQEELSPLASSEDAAYFRSLAKQKTIPPKIAEPLRQVVIEAPSNEKKAPPELEAPLPSLPPPLQKVEEPLVVKQDPKKMDWRSEPQVFAEALNFTSLKAAFQKAFPHIAVLDDIPSDAMAKKIASRWKTKNQIAPISILHFSEPPKQKALLCEIAKAIDISFGPARLINAETIEKEKQWETFLASETIKLVIACDYTLWQLSDLLRHYKEIPAQQMRTLGNVPLLLLPDLSLYLKDPLLKRSLWKAICKAVERNHRDP